MFDCLKYKRDICDKTIMIIPSQNTAFMFNNFTELLYGAQSTEGNNMAAVKYEKHLPLSFANWKKMLLL